MFGLHYLTQSVPQSAFIPSPPLTEANLPDQAGRVHLVTGANSGVGEQLMQILYSKNATVYVAARSRSKADEAIARARALHPSSTGRLDFLPLDLADLRTVRPAVDAFLARERRLDVLVNNAGVMFPPAAEPSAQGHEMQLATNCLGPFLLTKLLTPLLVETARTAAKDSVRVIWASSLANNLFSPAGGVALDDQGVPKNHRITQTNYGQSKTGNQFYAVEFHRRHAKDGVVSVTFNPGNLQSGLQRHLPGFVHASLTYLGYPPRNGAYTELFCGWSPDITMEKGGSFIIPWGRLGNDYVRPDLAKIVEDNKTNPDAIPRRFWQWSDDETTKYA
ncbi:short-chain dehydrogenase [Cordyceps fumosorosea ARSEF 2679]|uniref:Short-chain dehydrogenase n=1 Tax=Cordyceps fumosorosea (strain ARSEF 2679) TaxID=1081104 RepID=A0A167STT6_CORFA|nr:short-chain dehydrogenase [Cordyceps fumosorosea ARSEF 2679]OAA59920.1 short-chain dehydrogenase [Cordyceps fumosorosea ARSEF 2679]